MSSDSSYEMDCLSEGLLGMLDSQIHVVVVMVVVVNVLMVKYLIVMEQMNVGQSLGLVMVSQIVMISSMAQI